MAAASRLATGQCAGNGNGIRPDSDELTTRAYAEDYPPDRPWLFRHLAGSVPQGGIYRKVSQLERLAEAGKCS